jgi:hypothetical protein
MLTFAADFWPLFWGITGGAALLTVLLSALIAIVPSSSSRRAAAVPALLEPATRRPTAAREHAEAA